MRNWPGALQPAGIPAPTGVFRRLSARTGLAVDQPSTVLASFADPAIAEHGAELDRQLARLLDTLGVEANVMPAAEAPPVGAYKKVRPPGQRLRPRHPYRCRWRQPRDRRQS